MVEDDYYLPIAASLHKVSGQVIHYDSPQDFLDHIGEHKNDLVISLWSGVGSRNRRALVPSICEAYRIRYVGADTYTSILSQDKYLAKRFAQRFGLKISADLLVAKEAELSYTEKLSLPLVVKPNFEGGSIGIAEDSLARTYPDATKVARRVLRTFNQPVLIEEFLRGEEVSVIILGTQDRIDFIQLVRISLDLSGQSLSNEILYDLLKKRSGRVKKHDLLEFSAISDSPSIFVDLFFALGKVDMLRVDGRLVGDDFYFIELTPDIHLGPTATYAQAFDLRGISYDEMIAKAVQVSLENWGV